MDSRELLHPQREKLRAMLKTIFPEYPSIAVGTEYVSFTTDKQPDADTEWKKVHWVPLLLGESLRRLSLLGRKDDVWIKNVVSNIIFSFIYTSSTHPVDTIYDQYLSILMEFNIRVKNKGNNDNPSEEGTKELLQKV
jgi:hypothetical protein